MPRSLCLDCGARHAPQGRCPACGSPRRVAHPELDTLAVAHVDCDAFYASVEKREDPTLRDRPVIVGGGRRGVVSTACYIARIRGVRSAMPMFKALALCPEAVVIRPRMALYAEVSQAIRAKMDALTPLVEPLSLDEAFLDLSGTERLHRRSPAESLAALAREIEREIGITVSVGLSHNRFLAKLASELEKPRGFAVIGRAETLARLAPMPVRALPGVGPAAARRLEAEGLRTVADLRCADPARLARGLGMAADRLLGLAQGIDLRPVRADGAMKSISGETTFEEDLADPVRLDGHLWRMAERVAARAKAKGLAARTVTLKLRRADFRLLTRSTTLPAPVRSAHRIHAAAAPLLARELAAAPFRLLGVGLGGLGAADGDGAGAGFLAPADSMAESAERAVDAIRARFGETAILKGRALR